MKLMTPIAFGVKLYQLRFASCLNRFIKRRTIGFRCCAGGSYDLPAILWRVRSIPVSVP